MPDAGGADAVFTCLLEEGAVLSGTDPVCFGAVETYNATNGGPQQQTEVGLGVNHMTAARTTRQVTVRLATLPAMTRGFPPIPAGTAEEPAQGRTADAASLSRVPGAATLT